MTDVKKADLLKAKTVQSLADTVFPTTEDFKHIQGAAGDIIIIVDQLDEKVVIHRVTEKPHIQDFKKAEPWQDNEYTKFVFQEDEELLILQRDFDPLKGPRYQHTRIPWTTTGITKSVLESFRAIEFNHPLTISDLLDRKEVTSRFYDDYVQAVAALQDGISGLEALDAKRLAERIAQRLIFLHFIQEKGLLDSDKGFLKTHFYDVEVKPYAAFQDFCFNVLNAPGHKKGKWGTVPYLNGGLFRPTDVDEADHELQDEAFRQFIGFLGGYGAKQKEWNWLLDESKTDDDLALDPAVLGHIFEKTVNQKDAGAYYTPRTIAEYMSRQGIHGHLLRGLSGHEDSSPRDYTDIVAELDGKAILAHLPRLRDITVIDNACGSGAFLLTGLNEIASLWQAFLERLTDSDAEREKLLTDLLPSWSEGQSWRYNVLRHAIAHNIYGVDIEEGGVEVARLRLWLRLIAEAPDEPERVEALPNVDYNLRVGNSILGLVHLGDANTTLTQLQNDKSAILADIIEDGSDWSAGSQLVDVLRGRSKVLAVYRDARDAALQKKCREALMAISEVRVLLDETFETRFIKLLAQPDQYHERREAFMRPFHWFFEFPAVMDQGGFDVILTNPPWENLEAEIRKFHSSWLPGLTNKKMVKGKEATQQIKALWKQSPSIEAAWNYYRQGYAVLSRILKGSRIYQHQGRGRPNLYKLFLERYTHLLAPAGSLVAVVQGGFYHDSACGKLRQLYWTRLRLREVLGFENNKIFDGVHPEQKFVIVHASKEGPQTAASCFFMQTEPEALFGAERVTVSTEDIQSLYPQDGQFPSVASTQELHVLLKTATFPPYAQSTWGDPWTWEVHQKSETGHLFTSTKTALPIMEGDTVSQYEVRKDDAYQFGTIPDMESHYRAKFGASWQEQLNGPRLCFREVTNQQNQRTLIAAILRGPVATTHTLWVESLGRWNEEQRYVLLGLLNTIMADYLAKRLANRHMTKEMLKALRLPQFEDFTNPRRIMKIVKRIEATNGAYDRARAELDVTVFKMYGLAWNEVELVWATMKRLAKHQPGYLDELKAAW